MPGSFSGHAARITWQYHTAADITGYRITVDDITKDWTLTATLATSDAYALGQRPLVFVAPTKRGAVRCEIRSLVVRDDGTVFARLAKE